jgi:hypothetical protein
MTTKGKDAKRKGLPSVVYIPTEGKAKPRKRGRGRKKGARVELAAAKYLTALGFAASRMGRNGYSAADLKTDDCPVLSLIHIEVKGDQRIDFETVDWKKAMAQAQRDANKKPWALLWKLDGLPWRLTFQAWIPPLLVTVTGDERIRESLRWLSQGAAQ